MKLELFLDRATAKLEAAGIGSGRLDALILVADELDKERSWLLAHPEAIITDRAVQRLEKKLKRRRRHEPLSYIRGFTEFYGRRFKVNRHVLEPRPESEAMIDLLKTLKLPKEARIADVGTGSGALGISAALELDSRNIDLFDIDASALAVAKHNCALHELHLRTIKRDLLRNSHKAYDVILANLPYIPNHWQLHPSVRMEPKIALYGGSDGLDLYRRLFEQLTHFSPDAKRSGPRLKRRGWRPMYVLCESLPPQHKMLAEIARQTGFKLVRHRDFIQVFKPV